MESSNDISHPVRDAFQELGHKARVAATSAYVALPVLMASAPSVAYAHETGQTHEHAYQQNVAVALATFVLGVMLTRFSIYQTSRPASESQKGKYVTGTVGGILSVGSLIYLSSL